MKLLVRVTQTVTQVMYQDVWIEAPSSIMCEHRAIIETRRPSLAWILSEPKVEAKAKVIGGENDTKQL